MKKEYIICSEHPELRFENEDGMMEHVKDIHSDEIDDYLDSYRDEAVDHIASQLKETVKAHVDEEETDEEIKINFDKIRREVAAGKQRTLGISGGD